MVVRIAASRKGHADRNVLGVVPHNDFEADLSRHLERRGAKRDRRRAQIPYPGEDRRRHDRRVMNASIPSGAAGVTHAVVHEAKNPIAVVGLLALAAVAVPTYLLIVELPAQRAELQAQRAAIGAVTERLTALAQAVDQVGQGQRAQLEHMQRSLNATGGTHYQHSRALETLQDTLDRLQGIAPRRRIRYPGSDSRIGFEPAP